MQFRKIIFWLHLLCGCVAGVIILVMSLTGVLLTYEKQILAATELGAHRVAPPAGATRLPAGHLLEAIRARRPVSGTATLTLRSDPSEPAEIRNGRGPALYVNPYSGEVLGETSESGTRAFFQTITAWHRWLGVEGSGRDTARALTGACNLSFLILMMSGAYLWLPKRWSWPAVRSILWFRASVSGKARDFNWHNVFGVWALIPLFFVVASALPISYQWAGDLLYRMTGSEPPPPLARGGGEAHNEAETARMPVENIDKLWNRAMSENPAWKTISARIAVSPREPMTFSIDTGNGGQPQKRSTLALDPATVAVVKTETFADASAGRRLRMWTRFVHTGEYYGVVGQTVAGVASIAGVFLVWTGISLAIRRFYAWNARRSRRLMSPDLQEAEAEPAERT